MGRVLISQETLARNDGAKGWHARAYADLAARLTAPSDFPCTFSQNAFRRQLIRFSLVEDMSPHALDRAAADLEDYVGLCARWDGRINAAHPLLVVFSPDAANGDGVDHFHAIGWRFLQQMHERDRSDWLTDVETDPHQPFFSFCFAGVQLFVNMSNPAHRSRKSRNLGRHLTLVINPRERFDIVAGDTPEGRGVRAHIRRRCQAYDGQPHAPQLGSFQKGELEAPQYGLPDNNADPTPDCPFTFLRHRDIGPDT